MHVNILEKIWNDLDSSKQSDNEIVEIESYVQMDL